MAEALRDRSGDPIRERVNVLLDKAFALESRAAKRGREATRARQTKEEGRVPFPPV
jgi:hypothetical protein